MNSSNSKSSLSTSLRMKHNPSGSIVPVKAGSHIETGLANLGNTCFMNSSLQLLLHVDPLVNYFLSGKYQNDLNPKSSTKGEVASSFHQLVLDVAKSNRSSNSTNESNIVSPVRLQKAVGHFAPYLMDYSQQDCQEFLRFILDGLNEDLKVDPQSKIISMTPNKDVNVSENQNENQMNDIINPPANSDSGSPNALNPVIKNTLNSVEKLRLKTKLNSNNNDEEIDDATEINIKKAVNAPKGIDDCESLLVPVESNSTDGVVTSDQLHISDTITKPMGDMNVYENTTIAGEMPQPLLVDTSTPSATCIISPSTTAETTTVIENKGNTNANSTVESTGRVHRKLADQAWEQYMEKNRSVISDIFAGQLQSTVTCTECHHQSLSFDPFLDISVPIPREVKSKSAVSDNSSIASKITPWRVRSSSSNGNIPKPVLSSGGQDVAVTRCTLEECLEEFTGMNIN